MNCFECKKFISGYKEMLTHFNMNHDNLPYYQCTIVNCDRRYKKPFYKHIKTCHPSFCDMFSKGKLIQDRDPLLQHSIDQCLHEDFFKGYNY